MLKDVICPMCKELTLTVIVGVGTLYVGGTLQWTPVYCHTYTTARGYQALNCKSCGLLIYDEDSKGWRGETGKCEGTGREPLGWLLEASEDAGDWRTRGRDRAETIGDGQLENNKVPEREEILGIHRGLRNE